MITNLEVTFGRKVKPADYEGADAIVKLSGVVPEGDDALVILNHMAAMAKAKVLEMLGLRRATNADAGGGSGSVAGAPSPQAQPQPPASAAGTKEAAAAAMNAADAAPGKPKGARKAPVAASPTPASAPAAGAPGAAAGTADMSDMEGSNKSFDQPHHGHAPAADDMSDLLAAPAKPITDVELNDAIQKKFKETADSASIRALSAKFIEAGKAPTCSNIPQKNRVEYLAALAALKKP